jgi:hypothetical protein
MIASLELRRAKLLSIGVASAGALGGDAPLDLAPDGKGGRAGDRSGESTRKSPELTPRCDIMLRAENAVRPESSSRMLLRMLVHERSMADGARIQFMRPVPLPLRDAGAAPWPGCGHAPAAAVEVRAAACVAHAHGGVGGVGVVMVAG